MEGESPHLFLLLALSDSHSAHFESPPVDGHVLRDVFIKYGRSARHCYKLAEDSTEQKDWEDSIPGALSTIPNPETFRSNLAGHNLNHGAEVVLRTSSQLITIFPRKDRRPQVDLVSKHVTSHLFDAIDLHKAERYWEFFNQFWSVKRSRQTAGWLWEPHVLNVLSSDTKRHIPFQHLPRTQSRLPPVGINLPFSAVHRFGHEEALATQLVKAIPSLMTGQKILFIPAISNHATYDAFSVSDGGLIELYQATVGEKHPLRVSGLDFLWDVLILAQDKIDQRNRTKIKRLFPSGKRRWRVIFPIPQRVQPSWKKPQRIDFGHVTPKRQWRNYIEQFFMVLDDRSEGGSVATGGNKERQEEGLQFGEEVGPSAGKREQPHRQKRTRAVEGDEDTEEEPLRKAFKQPVGGLRTANTMAKRRITS